MADSQQSFKDFEAFITKQKTLGNTRLSVALAFTFTYMQSTGMCLFVVDVHADNLATAWLVARCARNNILDDSNIGL